MSELLLANLDEVVRSLIRQLLFGARFLPRLGALDRSDFPSSLLIINPLVCSNVFK